MDEGIDTRINEEHPLNARSPIDITDEGISNFFKDVQSLKHENPIVTT